ncbi:hypothetical protein [Hyphomicrobium sp. LHD-15]|nr:hypothetical protein [Hyphomicrobium sp. LHD-15]MDQ8699251.1 hypothetical protein [Hyphomicrobium sp. LHD-15]
MPEHHASYGHPPLLTDRLVKVKQQKLDGCYHGRSKVTFSRKCCKRWL